jgi:methyl-viologen-reducing hydrogenase delta subunit
MTVKRITFLQEMLSFIGLDGRVHLEWISSAEAQKFVQVVTDFTEKIRSLGPNPLAGANSAMAGLLSATSPLKTDLFSPNTQMVPPDGAGLKKEAINESKSETVA